MSAVDVASAAGLGIALGVVTGMPIGVVNVAILDAALRGQRRYAAGIGVGGAIADSIHAAIAFIGIGRLVTEHPSWSRTLAVIAAVVIASYALLASRSRPTARARHGKHGVLAGLLLTLPNPAALGAWCAVAAVLWPSITLGPAIAISTGVGVGSVIWFTLLARFLSSLPPEHRFVRWLPKLAAALLVALAVSGIVRAFWG